MTPSETRFLRRLILFLVLAALCPLGAFVYRVSLKLAPTTLSAPEPLFTLIPGAIELSFATPTPTTVVVVVPHGWTEYQVHEHGFAVSVPTVWQRLPITPAELDAALQTIRQSNPDMADALGASASQLLASGVKFWAFDLNARALQSRFAPNVTVARQTLPTAVSFETYVAVNLNQLNALENRTSPVAHDRTSIAGLPAERIRYSLLLTTTDGSRVPATITQYLLLNGTDAYVLTYAARADLLGEYAPAFEQSARSFRFLPRGDR